MSDEAFERKMNAATHIDELAESSRAEKGTKKDRDERHGEMASGGWKYRTAYFEDFDGKYYEVTISTAKNENGTMLYNVGQMQERSSPKIDGSSAADSGALRGEASSTVSIRSSTTKSNPQNAEKTKKSLKSDSRGRALTAAQQEYFADSQVLDKSGKLLPVYHTTYDEFTAFDRNRLGAVTDGNATEMGEAVAEAGAVPGNFV